jgi:hypothetical protein
MGERRMLDFDANFMIYILKFDELSVTNVTDVAQLH